MMPLPQEVFGHSISRPCADFPHKRPLLGQSARENVPKLIIKGTSKWIFMVGSGQFKETTDNEDMKGNQGRKDHSKLKEV